MHVGPRHHRQDHHLARASARPHGPSPCTLSSNRTPSHHLPWPSLHFRLSFAAEASAAATRSACVAACMPIMLLRTNPRLELSRRYIALRQLQSLHDRSVSPSASDFIRNLQQRQNEGVDEYSLSNTLELHKDINRKAFRGRPTGMRKVDLKPKNELRPAHDPPGGSDDSLPEDLKIRRWLGRIIMPNPIKGGLKTDLWRPLDQQWPSDRLLRLNQDIEDYTKWLHLTPSELALRERLTRSLIEHVKSKIEDVGFRRFGSQQTGMATPRSDVDIGFYIPSMSSEFVRGPSPYRPEARKAINRKLHEMEKLFQCSSTWKHHDTRGIGVAKYALVEISHIRTGITFQIVSASNQDSVTSAMKHYADEWPQTRPLFFILKAVLSSRKLNKTNSGGMGSYSLFVMIVAYLRNKHVAKSADCASALRGFFDFWGGFDTVKYGISADPPVIFPRTSAGARLKKAEARLIAEDEYLRGQGSMAPRRKDEPTWRLCLQNPLDWAQDLTRPTSRILDILETFRYLGALMSDWIDEKAQIDDYMSHLLGTATIAEARARRQVFKWINEPGFTKLYDQEIPLGKDSSDGLSPNESMEKQPTKKAEDGSPLLPSRPVQVPSAEVDVVHRPTWGIRPRVTG